MSYASAVLADAPRHYWRCADPGGIYLHDIGSTPIALLFEGSAFQTSLPYFGPTSDGGAVTLNGTQSAWDLQGDAIANPVSIECVVWQQERTPATQYLVLLITGATVAAGLHLNTGVPNLQGQSATRATSAAAISRQAWHHIVGTVDVAGNGKLYVDAVNVANAVVGAGGAATYQLVLGSTGPGATSFLSGSLAECAVYTTVLSPAQVTNHFVALDATANRPIFKANGTWTGTFGTGLSQSQDLASVLSAVRKTF